VLNKIFDLAPPLLIGMAVDVVVQQEDSFLARLGFTDVFTQLIVLAILTLVLWILESLFEYLFQVKWRNLAQNIQHQLRLDAYDHVQHLELSYFEDRSTGGLMAILNDDINQLERFLDVGANDIIQIATTVLVVGGVFVAIIPSVAWMALLPIPFIIWGSIAFQKKLAPRYAQVREEVGLLNAIIIAYTECQIHTAFVTMGHIGDDITPDRVVGDNHQSVVRGHNTCRYQCHGLDSTHDARNLHYISDIIRAVEHDHQSACKVA
jgi:ATP-binding cassette subfamily B protein